MKHQLSPKQRLLRLAILTPLVVLLALCFAAAPVQAQDPDFDTIDDPLNGDYELYTVDDLLISRTKPENSDTSSVVNNYILETENESISSQIVKNVDDPDCYLTSGRQPQQTRIGRFFDREYDVIVTLSPSQNNATGSDCTAPQGEPNMALHIQSTQFGANTASPFAMSAAATAVAMDDFNLDGFADLFIMSDTEMLVATAANVNDNNAGMVFGPALTFPASSFATNFDPTSGDFNGDGLKDIAWISSDYTVHFATVCPGPVADTICAGKESLDLLLDPLQSRAVPIRVTPELPGAGGCARNAFAVVAGNFSSNPADDLLVLDCASPVGTLNNFYTAYWYQFDGDWKIVGGAPIDQITLRQVDYAYNILAQAGRLDWSGIYDQVVFVIGSNEFSCTFEQITREFVGVITFNDSKMALAGTVGKDGECQGTNQQWPWVNGLALGHFASIADDTTSDSAFDQQIGTLLNDGSVRIYEVSPPASWTPSLVSQTTTDSSLAINFLPNLPPGPHLPNWLVSGDLQGRSARLGAPSVVRVASHSQPSVILGAPPMHVDYILPDQSTATDWEVVNFSTVPDTFNSSYTMSQTNSNQSSDTNRTSYTYATSEQGGASFSFKLPYLPSVSGSIKTTTENKNEAVSEIYQFTQNEFTYDASTTTGLGDEIWYGVSSFNVYYYPVLGETVCPADNSGCDPSEEQQLYVTFSGPSSTGTGPGPGANTEWYQPVHEPGNLFSYPWNKNQLEQQIAAGINLLTGPQQFYTDDSSQTQRLQWSSGSGQDQTAGSTNTHSYEKAYSLTGGKAIGKILDVNLQGNLDYSNSSSIGTLNKSSSSVGASQGIAIAKPGSFQNSNLYQYRIEPYIFGRTPPAGSVDAVTLPQDIQTSGPLQAAFAANPLDPQAGSWWASDNSSYTQQIDVALNHPTRWSSSAPVGTQTTLNCLEASGSRYNCLTFNDPEPDNLWNSEFYWMRGLFATVGGADGPQRTQATAGEEVVLQTRVYNYSFKDMPADAKIQVRFYRQEIQGTTPTGDSVLIDQVAIDPLPGFNSPNSPDTPNWTTATAALDTTGLDDTFQIFWVLVWVEDGAGNMIQELNGHGLSAKPGMLTSIGDVPLEEVTVDGAQKTFSNNVGYLHSKFYIAPETSPPAAIPPASPILSIQNVQVTPAQSTPGERVIISADILAGGAPAEAVHVLLYPDAQTWQAHQDDPSLPKPRAFDVEMLPYIRADESDPLEVPYRPQSCGTQEVLIWATVGAGADAVTATATVDNGACALYLPVVISGILE